MKYNNGEWTDARFRSFIMSALRSASSKWGPKHKVKKEARTKRGFYKCAGCSQEVPSTLPPLPGNKRRINNAVVDHIKPVIDPKKGFTSWDEVVRRMFCEADGLQLLCEECHTKKTNEEKKIGAVRRKKQRTL